MFATPHNQMARIAFFGKSDVGLVRSNNEDAFVVKPELGLCLVADGMGGAAAGEEASRIFTETALEVFSAPAGRSEEETLVLVQTAFRQANERILNHANENPHHKGMGCTAELVAFCDEGFVLGHVGDSRTYRLRNGQMTQLTQDHSVVQDQIDQGIISPAEATDHPYRNVILRAVGVKETVATDLVREKMLYGDVFLLCSDGLTDMVDDTLVHEVLSCPIALAQKAEKLIESAKSAGGHDNITAVLCEVIGD
jgi:protein phosphatase